MTGARIRRGEQAPRARSRTPARRKAKPGVMARMMAAVPVQPETIRSVTAWGGLLLAGAAAVTAAHLAGLFGLAWVSAAEATGRAGLRVEHVNVQGLKRMDELTVLAIALEDGAQAKPMPLVSLEPIRQRLLTYGWIADARVSRQLPDTIVIDIVEREPAAVWQHRGRLVLVDKAGVVLEPVGVDAMPDLPLVIGADANAQVAGLETLLAKTPAMRPMLAAATWIGGRRWDLRFQSGEVLALPEGGGAASTALVKFAGMDARDRLLGRGFERFDMRDPTRMVVRVNRDNGSIDETSAAANGDGSGRLAARTTT